MVADSRVTYKRRHCYATRSNKIKVVKTPGGKFGIKYRKKRAAAPKCGDCGKALQGIKCLRPKEYKHVSKHSKTVSRAYGGAFCWNGGVGELGTRGLGGLRFVGGCGSGCGSAARSLSHTHSLFPTSPHSTPPEPTPTKGSRCAHCVRNRIVRAFLIEEQKIVKKVLQEKKASQKKK